MAQCKAAFGNDECVFFCQKDAGHGGKHFCNIAWEDGQSSPRSTRADKGDS